MNPFDQLKELVAQAEPDAIKFYEKGNNSAGTRLRKTMQEAKALAQEGRVDVQDIKNQG